MKVIEAEKAKESQDFNNCAAAVAILCGEARSKQGVLWPLHQWRYRNRINLEFQDVKGYF